MPKFFPGHTDVYPVLLQSVYGFNPYAGNTFTGKLRRCSGAGALKENIIGKILELVFTVKIAAASYPITN